MFQVSTYLYSYDCTILRINYATLLGRELIAHLPFFTKNFSDCTPDHIHVHVPRKYSAQTRKKSVTVSIHAQSINYMQ